ncbi:MAG TPA: DUF4143 domain-containing protein [Methanocorpusculum sp.]|nr:DUF4143 domain-containing protein [Methanocorpusculum sp.]
MKDYRPRITDSILQRKLEAKGAILIEGTKWCGKTTTAVQASSSTLYLANVDTQKSNLLLSETNPSQLLKGKTPRLIDEWQLIPRLWDAVRFEVDNRRDVGQFILTGSSVPPDSEEIRHTGTGRFSWIKMRPMSLYESGESTGEVSLSTLFSSPRLIEGTNHLSFEDLAYVICRGGWPGALNLKKTAALDQAFDYFDAVIHSDINRADKISKNPERVKRLMRSFARNQGTQAPITVFREDMIANDNDSLTKETISLYLSALKLIFVIEDMPAWNPNLRSKTAIRTADTHYFVDPSIASASLGLGPKDLESDLSTFGFLFETLCIRDLRVYTDALSGDVYHYRDKTGLECDAVIHLRNGTYGLVEIKLGGDTLIEDAVKSLTSLKQKIDTDKMKEPAFMMVLTGVGSFAYLRPDGIYVVPIGCLGP